MMVSSATDHTFDNGISSALPNSGTSYSKSDPLINSDETASSHYGSSTRLSSDAKRYYSATALSITVPLVALIVWLSLNPSNWKKAGWSTVHSAVIGGRLTQSEAKAIDLLSSGFLAPIFLCSLNYIWFACARVAVVNEHHPKQTGVPLHTLVEVSSTTGGSYDVLKLSALLKPRTRRLMCLALLVIFSANVIAYEAFSEDGSGQSPDLRLLNAPSVAGASPFVSSIFNGLYGYNKAQQASFANQFTGMMTGVSLEDATSKLNNKTYTMVNATTASLNALPQNLSILHGVPANRWSVSCNVMEVNNQTFSILQMGVNTVQYNVAGNGADGTLFQGQYPGDIATLQDAYNNVYPLMAFSLDGSAAWLGFLTSFDLSNDTYMTPFGSNVKPTAVNMTASGFNGTKQVMSVWGVQCSINKNNGTVALQRSSDGSWAPVPLSGVWQSAKTPVQPLRLQQLQTNLNYNAPDVTLPGLMPALAASADPTGTTLWETLVLNFLYASAESERIANEVAATTLPADALAESTYTVASTQAVLRYRITYVPVILFVGIAALLGGAIVTTGLVVYSLRSRSTSAMSFRQVNVLRLVVDAAMNLDIKEGDHGNIDGAESNSRQEYWSKGYRVKYETEYTKDELGREGEKVVLQHVL
jgi:hypothetical protein